MALPANADVRGLLARMRDKAEWGWRGGASNDATKVRWEDPVQLEPTEAEYLAEQALVDAEDVTQVNTRLAQRGRSNTIVGLDPATFTPPQTTIAVEELLAFGGALDENGLVLPIEEWGRGIRKRFQFPT
jgi:hypothetical protein